MIIRIAEAIEETGFWYDIWLNAEEGEDIEGVDPDDGGLHTDENDMQGALDSAYDMASALIQKQCKK